MNNFKNFLMLFLAISVVILTGCPGMMNNVPEVDAGADQNGTAGKIILLEGKAADRDGDLLDLRWDIQSKPSASSLTDEAITDRTSGAASFTPDVKGIYELVLTANDGQSLAKDSVVITINESPAVLIEQGIASLKNKEYDQALTDFSLAVDADPDNKTAQMGYNLLNIGAMCTDPAIVDYIRNKIGITAYPSSMNDVIDPTKWMSSTIYGYMTENYGTENEIRTPMTALYPDIAGQENFDLDNDNNIALSEKLLAALANLTKSNTAIDDMIAAVATGLETRLDTALLAIDNSAADAEIALTWDMFNDPTAPNSASWPKDSSGNFITVKLGKPEMRLLGAKLQMIRHFIYFMKAYTFVLPLPDYWKTFYEDLIAEGDQNVTNGYPATPLSGNFFEKSAEGDTYLAKAKADITKAAEELMTAADEIMARPTGTDFFLSADSMLLFGSTSNQPTKDDFDTIISIVKRNVQEVKTSLTDNTVAVIPFYYGSSVEQIKSVLANWPTTADIPNTAFGFNFGLFYSDLRITASSLLEKRTANTITTDDIGEPVFYSLEVNGTIQEITSVTDANTSALYFVKLPDMTFGGSVPMAMYEPVYDNPQQKVSFYFNYYDQNYNGNWDYNDTNSNGIFDENDTYEQITYAYISSNLSGIIKESLINTEYGGDLAAYYNSGYDPDSISLSDLSVYTDHTAALKSAIKDYYKNVTNYIGSRPFAIMGTDNSLYVGFIGGPPADINQALTVIMAHSFTEKGSQINLANLSSSVPSQLLTSSGSAYWAFVDLIAAAASQSAQSTTAAQ